MAGFPNKLKRLVSKKNAKKDENAGEPIDTKPAQTAGGKEVETLKSVKTGGSGSTAASTSNKNNAATAAAAAAATVKPTKSTVSAAAAHRGKAAGSGKPVQLKSSKMAKPAPLKTSKTQSSQGALQKTPSATEKKISTQKRSPQPPAMRRSLTDGAEGRGSENNSKMKSSANGPGGRGSTENLAKASEKGSVVKLAAKDKTEEESIQELDGIIKELSISADIAVPTSSDHDDGVSEFSGGSAKSLESESEEEETDQEEEEEESKVAGIKVSKKRLSNTGGDAKLVTKEVPIPPRTPTFQSELSAKTEKIGNEIDDNAQGGPGKVANESVIGSVATNTTAAKQSAKKSIKSNASKATSRASGQMARGTGGKEGPTCDFTNGSASKGTTRSNPSLNQNAKNISRHVDRENGTTSLAAAKTNAELASAGGITSKRTTSRSGVGTKLTAGGYIKGKKNNDPKANVSRSGGTSTPENSAEKENVDALPSYTPNDTQTVDDAKPAEEKTSGAGPTILTVTKKKSLFSKAFKTNKSGSAKKFPDAATSEVKTEPSVITTSPNGGVTTEKKSDSNGDTTGKKSPPTGVTHEAEDVLAESSTTGVPPASDIKPKTSKAEAQSSKTKSRSKEHEFPSAVAPARAGKGSRQSHDVRPHPTSSGRNLYQSRDDKDDTSEEDREEYSQYNDGESIEMQRQLSGDISLYTKSTFGETMTFETHLDDIDEDDNDTMEDTEAIRHTDVIIHEPGEPSDLLMRVLYWKPQLEYGNDVIIQVEASTVSFRDCLLRRDIGPDRAKFPLVPGCEVVGTISLLNSNAKKRGYRVGDRVVAMSRNGGGNATFASFPVSCIAPISKNVDASEAVCLVDVYMTAHQALRLSKKQATPLTGSNVLITDGFTPVGQACVQLALMEGANVYVTAMESTQDSYLKSIGAKCLPFEPMEWLPKIQGRMDVVIDNTCFDSYDSSWKALNPNGILVCTGMTSLYSVLDHERELYGCDAFGNMTVKIQAMWAETKAKYIMSRTMFHDLYANMQNDPKVYQQELKYLCFMLEKGRIKPKIDSKVGIEDVSDCHRRIEAGKANGTIVCLP